MSTKKAGNPRSHGDPAGIYHCSTCMQRREHTLADADPNDPCYAVQCWKCMNIIMGSAKTMDDDGNTMSYGDPMISDEHFEEAQHRTL